MRMKFRCKECGKVIFLHERQTQVVINFMIARQKMFKFLWNKDFCSSFDRRMKDSIVDIISKEVKCCSMPNIKMYAFHGYE